MHLRSHSRLQQQTPKIVVPTHLHEAFGSNVPKTTKAILASTSLTPPTVYVAEDFEIHHSSSTQVTLNDWHDLRAEVAEEALATFLAELEDVKVKNQLLRECLDAERRVVEAALEEKEELIKRSAEGQAFILMLLQIVVRKDEVLKQLSKHTADFENHAGMGPAKGAIELKEELQKGSEQLQEMIKQMNDNPTTLQNNPGRGAPMEEVSGSATGVTLGEEDSEDI